MMTINEIAQAIGYIFMTVSAGLILFYMVIFAAFVGNHAVHKLVDHIGGWKTFLEYREWYHRNKEKQ